MSVRLRPSSLVLTLLLVSVGAWGLRAAETPDPGPEFRGHEIPHLDPYPSGTSIPGLDSLAATTFDAALQRLGVRGVELGFDKRWAEDDTFRLALVEDLLDDPMALPGFQTELVQSIRDRVGHPTPLLSVLGRLLSVEPRGVRVRVPREILPGHLLEELQAQALGDGVHQAAVEIDQSRRGTSWSGVEEEESVPRRSTGAVDADRDVSRIVQVLGNVQDDLDRAFRDIPLSERTHLLMGAPVVWGGEEDPVDLLRKGAIHYELGAPVDTTAELESDRVLDAAVALDRADLLRAARALARATEQTAALTTSLRAERPLGRPGPRSAFPIDPAFGPLKEKITGSIYGAWPSAFGWIVIGGSDDNVYPEDVLREIAVLGDIGGDDVYRGRAASSVGQLLRSASILVDLEGDDLYDARGHAYALGGAILGCATLVDLDGNDTYLGDTGSAGAGYFGVGCLYDRGGRDRFEGTSLTQGAGAFGIGMLINHASGEAPPRREVEPDVAFEQGVLPVPRTGSLPIRHDENDTYVADIHAQGFASTFAVGLLYDDSGNDVYRAGGRYLAAPLLPHDFYSLSQGFSIGFRPRAAGGVGLLIDEAGNDFYDAEVYAQGTGYWYSLGLLFDGTGNDRYLATQYAQGAGVHLAIGSLWDRGGDDHYVSKNGVVQGTGHDLSVALLRDESGNDVYSVSGGQGVSLSNSFALFLDEMGDDLYSTYQGSRGYVRHGRGFSGAAVFLDLEGNDHYPPQTDAANAAEWRTSNYAIGFDLDRNVTLPTEDVPEILLTAEDSLRSVDELFETASLWEVGSAREKVRRARMALIARGMPAVLYATGSSGPYPEGEPLATDAGLVYRTIQELARAHPDSFAARILPRLTDPDEQVQRNVIGLLGDLKWEPAREPLEARLADPAPDAETHRTRLIRALGRLGYAEAAPAIRPFLGDAQERRRIIAAEALKLLGDEASIPEFAALLSDPYFTVRAAAMSGLVSFRELSVEPIATVLEQTRDPRGTDSSGSPGLSISAGAPGVSGSSESRGTELTRVLDRAHAVLTLSLVTAALADSTSEAPVAARDRAVEVLLDELDSASRKLRGGASPDSSVDGSDPAAVASAAVQGLLSLDHVETRARVESLIDGVEAPLVRRTWERKVSD